MAKYRIKCIEDIHDCETCGTSWAEGYVIYKDNIVLAELIPNAHCFGGTSFEFEDAVRIVVEDSGNEFEFN